MQIVYLAGSQRSGSTLVGSVLGELPGWYHAGELALFWQAQDEDRPCTCGRPCSRCDLWRALRAEIRARTGASMADYRQLADLVRCEVRIRRMHRLLSANRTGSVPLPLERLRATTTALLESLCAATSASVIVDSSKSAAWAAFLQLVPQARVRVVHLTRDPRGVVASWASTKERTVAGQTDTIVRRSWLAAVGSWNVSNLAVERLARSGTPPVRIRFEDLAAKPRSALEGLLAAIAVEPSADVPVDGRTVTLTGARHGIAGNPDRLVWRERITIAAPPGERDALLAGWRGRAVDLATTPLRGRYGYR